VCLNCGKHYSANTNWMIFMNEIMMVVMVNVKFSLFANQHSTNTNFHRVSVASLIRLTLIDLWQARVDNWTLIGRRVDGWWHHWRRGQYCDVIDPIAAAAAEWSWNWPAPPGTCRGTDNPGDSSPANADREFEIYLALS